MLTKKINVPMDEDLYNIISERAEQMDLKPATYARVVLKNHAEKSFLKISEVDLEEDAETGVDSLISA